MPSLTPQQLSQLVDLEKWLQVAKQSSTTKEWSELSTKEVENIFSLRSEVFVVEQDCVYQDIDGKDPKAKHVLCKKNNEIIAYARIFKPGDYFEEASFGRAVVKKSERGKGIGDELVINSIKNTRSSLF